MQIAVAMAGYQPGEADMIRKAVAKKIKRLMEKHQRMFREGAIRKGIDPEVADRVWNDIEFFARYGFNRAHATDYAVITAQTAYLRAHYPLEFMTALMTTERHNTEKLGFLIADARRNDMDVVGPCINASDVEFKIEKDENGHRFIRIGLGAIKNVGDEAMQMLVDARNAGGPFGSLDDFADRVDLRKLNRKTLECLIQAGALDNFGERPALLTLIDALLGTSAQIHSARDVGQFTLFDNMTDLRRTIVPPSYIPPIPDRQLLEWEKELLGTYLSRHPLSDQERELLAQELISTTIGNHTTEAPGQVLKVVGMVQRVRRITTKKGDTMAFVTLEGSGGTLDSVVFPRTYEQYKELLTENRVLVASGKLDSRPDRDDHPLLVEWFKEPHEFLRPMNDNGYAVSDPLSSSVVHEGSEAAFDPQGDIADSPSDDNGNGRKSTRRHRGAPATNDAPPWETSAVASSASRPSDNGDQRRKKLIAPPEPPAPPSTLYITLRRSGNNARDFELLARIHDLLKADQGADQFVVVLEGPGRDKIELEFPNERTQYTPRLRRQIASLIGSENLRIVQQARW